MEDSSYLSPPKVVFNTCTDLQRRDGGGGHMTSLQFDIHLYIPDRPAVSCTQAKRLGYKKWSSETHCQTGRQTDRRMERRWLAKWQTSRSTDGPRQDRQVETVEDVEREEVRLSLTLNPEEFFFASAFSRVAFKADFVFL